MRYGLLFALLLVLQPLLVGCDAADADPTVLPRFELEESFVFPRDSLVTLPTSNLILSFQFDGGIVLPGERITDTSDEPLGLSGVVQAAGLEPTDLRRIEAAGPFNLLHGAPATEDLSYIEEIALSLSADGVPDFEVARGGPFPSTGAALLDTRADEIPLTFATMTDVRGRITLDAARWGQVAIYRLRVQLPLRIQANAAPPLGTSERLLGEETDVRSFVQAHGHSPSSVTAAFIRRVRITPEDSTAFSTDVERAVVRLRAGADDGDGIRLAEILAFDRPVNVSRNVTELVREGGPIELVVDLDLVSGGELDEGALSFTAAAEMDIEVQ